MPYIDGKWVNLPSSVTKAEVEKHVKSSKPRSIVKLRPTGNLQLNNHEKVSVDEDTKFKSGPIRNKAMPPYSYGGKKTDFQKRLIFSQVADIEEKWFKGGIDVDSDYNWIRIRNFKLPDAWASVNDSAFTQVLLIIPDNYPNIPPNGFYLPSSINVPSGESHFFERGYGGAYGSNSDEIENLRQSGWKWYCTHITPESWDPARIRNLEDWRKGDNLWEVFTMINEVLNNPYAD